MRICIVSLAITLLAATPALAGDEARVANGVRLYQQGSFARARDQLRLAILDLDMPDEQRIRAHTYLAASLLALRDPSAAKEQLKVLAREYPHARLDPGEVVPELIQLDREAHAEVDAELRAALPADDPPPRRRPQPEEEDEEDPFAAAPETTSELQLSLGAFGLADITGASVGAGLGAGLSWGSVDAAFRVLLGEATGGELQATMRFASGALQPRLGVRATLVPGLDAVGAGFVAGARLELAPDLYAAVDLAAEVFSAPDDRRRLAVPLTAGIDFAF